MPAEVAPGRSPIFPGPFPAVRRRNRPKGDTPSITVSAQCRTLAPEQIEADSSRPIEFHSYIVARRSHGKLPSLFSNHPKTGLLVSFDFLIILSETGR
jgi:hypothetical protein